MRKWFGLCAIIMTLGMSDQDKSTMHQSLLSVAKGLVQYGISTGGCGEVPEWEKELADEDDPAELQQAFMEMFQIKKHDGCVLDLYRYLTASPVNSCDKKRRKDGEQVEYAYYSVNLSKLKPKLVEADRMPHGTKFIPVMDPAEVACGIRANCANDAERKKSRPVYIDKPFVYMAESLPGKKAFLADDPQTGAHRGWETDAIFMTKDPVLFKKARKELEWMIQKCAP
jgi:hypothetical protein